MSKINIKRTLLLSALFFPQLIFAQSTIQGVISEVKGFLALLVPLVVGLALLFFLWGMAKLIFRAGDEKAREEARRVMVWGVLSLFIVISIWGIVSLLQFAFFGGTPLHTLPINPNP